MPDYDAVKNHGLNRTSSLTTLPQGGFHLIIPLFRPDNAFLPGRVSFRLHLRSHY